MKTLNCLATLSMVLMSGTTFANINKTVSAYVGTYSLVYGNYLGLEKDFIDCPADLTILKVEDPKNPTLELVSNANGNFFSFEKIGLIPKRSIYTNRFSHISGNKIEYVVRSEEYSSESPTGRRMSDSYVMKMELDGKNLIIKTVNDYTFSSIGGKWIAGRQKCDYKTL